jgi:SAM-dependent methyltransferase
MADRWRKREAALAEPGTIEQRVARHYAQAELEKKILDLLAADGKDIEWLTLADLAPVDEFHTGGREATIAFAAELGFTPEMHILDVGCGIGGPSRYIAETLWLPRHRHRPHRRVRAHGASARAPHEARRPDRLPPGKRA